MQLTNSQLANMNFTGGLSLPYLFKDLPYKATIQRDSQQKLTYLFAPKTDVEASLWKAKFKLENTINLIPLTLS